MQVYQIITSAETFSEPYSAFEEAKSELDSFKEDLVYFNASINSYIDIVSIGEEVRNERILLRTILKKDSLGHIYWVEQEPKDLQTFFMVKNLTPSVNSIFFEVQELLLHPKPLNRRYVTFSHLDGTRSDILASLISKESLLKEPLAETYYFNKEDNIEEIISRLWTLRETDTKQQITHIQSLLLKVETTDILAHSLKQMLSKLLDEKFTLEKGCSKEFISFKSRND